MGLASFSWGANARPSTPFNVFYSDQSLKGFLTYFSQYRCRTDADTLHGEMGLPSRFCALSCACFMHMQVPGCRDAQIRLEQPLIDWSSPAD
jgi:hypothetical protein